MNLPATFWRSPRFLMPLIGIVAVLTWAISTNSVAGPIFCNVAPVMILLVVITFIVRGVIFYVARLVNHVSGVRASVEDRLDVLERLKRRDLVTPNEYAAKRQDILKDL